MKRVILAIILTILVAGETIGLLYAKKQNDDTARATIAEKLSSIIYNLSIELRLGEREKFYQLREEFASKLQEFQKYDHSKTSNLASDYLEKLQSEKTENILKFNQASRELNRKIVEDLTFSHALKDVKLNQFVDDTNMLEISEIIAKIDAIATRFRLCGEGCPATEYAQIKSDFENETKNLDTVFETLNQDFADYLGVDQLLNLL